LTALARHASNRTRISEAGGIGPLVELLLGSLNARAREHVELALVRLSIESETRVMIIEQLIDKLKDDRGTAAQEQAAAALANLARESVENRTSILKAGGVPLLLNLLESTSKPAKENAASAVSQLAYQNRQNQNAMCAPLHELLGCACVQTDLPFARASPSRAVHNLEESQSWWQQ
jgi:vacuolar protein 8